MRFAIWLLCICAVAAAAASAFYLQRMDIAVMAAVGFLAAAQFLSAFAGTGQDLAHQEELDNLSARVRKNSSDISSLHTRGRDYAQKLAELTDAVERRAAALPAPEAAGPQMQALAPPPAEAASDGAPVDSKLVMANLFLEPVVRLSEGRTAYYKATLQVPGVPPRSILSADGNTPDATNAEAAGRLDLELLNLVMPVLNRLQTRGGASGIFCPLSKATLATRPLLERYVTTLKNNPDAAAGIVLDLNQQTLSQLDEHGMRGLAWLASLGATMCLTGAANQTTDMAALGELGFAFLDMPVPAGETPANAATTSWLSRFSGEAQAHNISLILSGVSSPAVLEPLAQHVNLARGTNFAAPRAVRTAITEDRRSSSAAVA